MICAVIFDCFGVLAEDGWLPFKRKYVGQNKRLAREIADLGKQNEHGMIDNRTMAESVARLLGVPTERFLSATGKRVPNEELLEYIATELKPDYKIGLMSNANYDVVHKLFTPAQARLFDASVLSYESKMVKPNPNMYKLIAERLEVEAAECVFIDDQERYAEAAASEGMKALVYDGNLDRMRRRLGELLAVG